MLFQRFISDNKVKFYALPADSDSNKYVISNDRRSSISLSAPRAAMQAGNSKKGLKPTAAAFYLK